MLAFWNVLSDVGLEDLGYSRPNFTWFKVVTGGVFVQVRLDHVVANSAWKHFFPEFRCGIFSMRILAILVWRSGRKVRAIELLRFGGSK